jgi:ferric-dicitrate binding protein FerR (iron transport regulator)
MNDQETLDLFRKYREGSCTPEESAWVESWFLDYVKNTPEMSMIPAYQATQKEIWGRLGFKRQKNNYIPVLQYAAALLLAIGISWGSYHAFIRKTAPQNQIAIDIKPGGNSAVLTLADGKTIRLDSASNGTVATLSSGVLITNSASNGIVSYQEHSETEGVYRNTKSERFNKINTPAGGQYQLILPDGTRVFLNALSYLEFPSRFAGSERKVNLVGEAYFEVTKDPKKPFIVSTKEQQLTVLGTHFNVSAYPGEIQKTTLAEGSVELLLHPSTITGIRQLLKPNQQALLLSSGFQVKEIDASEATAWKDGNFVFTQSSLREALLQISRWYVVEVNIANIPDTSISGQFPRTFTLQQVLQGIQKGTGIKIQLKDGGLTYIR